MARQRRTGSKKGGKIAVDFSDVKDFKTSIPEDKYVVKIKEVKQTVSSNKNPQLEISMVVTEGSEKGFTFKHWVSLSAAALYRLKQLFDAFGMDYKSSGRFEFDPQDLVDLEAIAQMFNETIDGKTRSKVASFYPIDDEYDDEDEDDYEDEDEDEDEDDDDDDYEDEDDEDIEDELNDLDKDELKEVAEELEISSKAIKKAKNKKALIKLIMKEDEDDIAEVLEDL